MKTTYKEFDAAAYLDNDEVIAEYLSAAADGVKFVVVAENRA